MNEKSDRKLRLEKEKQEARGHSTSKHRSRQTAARRQQQKQWQSTNIQVAVKPTSNPTLEANNSRSIKTSKCQKTR